MWKIIDQNGTIYSGTQDEMDNTFAEIDSGEIELSWDGDLELVQVVGTIK